MRYVEDRFTPSDVESEVRRRLADKATTDLVHLLTYHVCVRMKYSRMTMINRFHCIPSMINTIDIETRKVYNDVLFCFDVHEIQKHARV